VTGEEYESYIRTRYLEPAGLAMTGFEGDGGLVATEYTGPAEKLQPAGARAYRWGRRASLGLVSTAGDLYRWFQALSDPRVVPARVRAELFQVRGRTDYGSEQGYGLELINRGQGHRLWRRVAGTPGMEGEILYDPDQEWTAVILVNTRLGWRFRVWRDIERSMWGASS
jgi:CubicO group peptidase (beta-lactamase class C family)